MTLTINLAPKTEAWISVEAQHLGVQPADVVRIVLEERMAATPHLTEQASDGKTPAEMLLGLFSRPADAALMDEVTDIAYEGRAAGSTRNIGL